MRALLVLLGAIAVEGSGGINGWYPCSPATLAEDAADLVSPVSTSPSRSVDRGVDRSAESVLGQAECATMMAPLCYDGVCVDDKERQIEIFFKRLPAVREPAAQPNVFMLHGGPGLASATLEPLMSALHELLGRNVNVYTMDHRGTGRSNFLDCVATQAQTSGSPLGYSVSAAEVASCAAELERRYGSDLAAFSITSAALDLQSFINTTMHKSSTFVYGLSYGTSLAERLMQLEPSGIKGYILDGIATTAGADVNQFEYNSQWDRDFNEAGERFLQACDDLHEECGKYFGSTASAALKALLQQLEDPAFACTTLLNDLIAGGLLAYPGLMHPSYVLRKLLGDLLESSDTRLFIPVLIVRLHRCNHEDQQVVKHFVHQQFGANDDGGDNAMASDLIYKIISYSELWEQPTPSFDEMEMRFLRTSISTGYQVETSTYCAFTKENSTGCKEFAVYSSYNASPIAYKRDKYWNRPPPLPSNTFHDALKTDNKKLVTFPHSPHGTIYGTPMTGTNDDDDDDDDNNNNNNETDCGMLVLASYVLQGGDLSKTDTSCVGKVRPISFALPPETTRTMLATDAAYDGPYKASLAKNAESDDAEDHGSRDTFKTFCVSTTLTHKKKSKNASAE
ncbi:hypothetical protein ATCC90586_009544 [Pythium insidiosum]|nr:hypothetical protein ATCC90586_009544 [Pythium insidiosum]